MSNLIRTLELKDLDLITYRDVNEDSFVRSINIDQVTGNFVITKPLSSNQPLIIYPQSPSNPTSSFIGEVKYFNNFSGYGLLDFPLDAKFDFVRGKLWIADAGNSRVLQINSNNFSVGFEIDDVVLPCSVCPDINTGGVFIMAFETESVGSIYYFDSSGILINKTNYPTTISSITITKTQAFIDSLPLSASMIFDHIRSRLWWANNGIIYMTDIKNGQIIRQDIEVAGYIETRGLDIDWESGNCFVVAKNLKGSYKVLQISKNNETILTSSYIAGDVMVQNTGGIITGENGIYPTKLTFAGFTNPYMNNQWDYVNDYKFYNNLSHFNIGQDYSGQSGYMSWGTYMKAYNVWRFFVAQYDTYPIITNLWIYSLVGTSPYGNYTLQYYDSIFDQTNPYPNDSGVVK